MNPIFEEMKTKAKAELECETKLRIYSQRKIDIDSVLVTSRSIGRSADFVHTEFGIVT